MASTAITVVLFDLLIGLMAASDPGGCRERGISGEARIDVAEHLLRRADPSGRRRAEPNATGVPGEKCGDSLRS